VRIRLKVSGGLASFPGLSKPREVDLSTLPSADADVLRQLVGNSRFFEREEAVKAQPVPDGRSYEVFVQDGQHARTLTVTDPVKDASLFALIQKLQGYR
jgi:hypothetical protein